MNDSVIEWWLVDFAKLDTVEKLGKRWLETDRPLDILMNNAGVGSSPGNAKVWLTEDGFEFIHQVREDVFARPMAALKLMQNRSIFSRTSS